MTPELKERLDTLIKQNKIVVFMKGNKLMPQCGFSNNVVQILNTLGVPYETVDVLEDYEIRQIVGEMEEGCQERAETSEFRDDTSFIAWTAKRRNYVPHLGPHLLWITL